MTEASSELVIVCQCPGAIYIFEIVKKCKISHPAQDQVAGDTHAEECHSALQLTGHTVYFIFGTTYLIEYFNLILQRQFHIRRKKSTLYKNKKNKNKKKCFLHMHLSILDQITWQAFPFKMKLYKTLIEIWSSDLLTYISRQNGML